MGFVDTFIVRGTGAKTASRLPTHRGKKKVIEMVHNSIVDLTADDSSGSSDKKMVMHRTTGALLRTTAQRYSRAAKHVSVCSSDNRSLACVYCCFLQRNGNLGDRKRPTRVKRRCSVCTEVPMCREHFNAYHEVDSETLGEVDDVV